MYKNKTQEQWTAWVDSITWDSHYIQVMMRLYPNSGFQYGNKDGKSGQVLYDAIMPFQVVAGEKVYDTKLQWRDVQAEVTAYKADLTREGDYAFRLLALHDWYQSKEDASLYSSANSLDSLIFHLLQEMDDTNLLAIEAADVPLKAAHDFEVGVAEKQARMALGQKCVATINYMNEQNSIEPAQVSAILGSSDVQNIMNALNTGSLNTAKALVTALDLTGLEPMDQSYKDKINGMIDDYLGV